MFTISRRAASISRPECVTALLTLLLVIIPTSAQQKRNEYSADFWTTDEGLPQNQVRSILQTRDGYIWLTTNDGLVRFDGVRFRVFGKGNTTGVESNRFNSLHEDADGGLWAGTEDGGLTRYTSGRFQSFTTAQGLPNNIVRGVWDDEASGLLVGTVGGLARWRRDDPQHLVSLRLEGAPPVTAGSFSNTGSFWVSVPGQVLRFTATTRETFIPPSEARADFAAIAVHEDAGNVWAGARDGRLFRFDQHSWIIYGEKEGLPGRRITTIYKDRSGRLWVGTLGSGLYMFEGDRFVAYLAADGTDSEAVECVYEDREGTIWLGTRNRGLARLRVKPVTTYGKRDQLSSDNVYTVHEDSAGRVWIGTWPGGLNMIVKGVVTDYTRKLGRRLTYVTALHEDRQGRLWVGNLHGVGWLKDDRFTDMSDQLGVSGSAVQVIQEDRAGMLWIGTNRGLVRFDGAQLTRYTTRDGLPGENIKDILQSATGALWIASYGGLARLNDDGKSFVAVTEREGLSSNHVRTLYEDADGKLWVGTYDGGLNVLRDGHVLARLTTAEGLFSDGIFRILEDSAKNFWMSTNRGIFRIARSELDQFAAGQITRVTSVAYGRADGMASAECNGGHQPAGWRTRDGKLWFPTQAGVAVIDPQSITLNSLAPAVVIEGALLDRVSSSLTPELRVTPDRENVEISYTGLSFVKPEQVRFRYRLEGVDSDWVEAGTRRVAYYSHLPPGSYSFKVTAANSDGVWNTQGASMQVVVVPPFYRTWWFLTLCVVSIVSAAVVFYERRVARLRNERETQAAFSRQLIDSQETERKRIAAELHDSIGQSLTIIKNRAALSLSRKSDHEGAVEQLGEISEAASYAIEEVREIAHDLRPIQLDQLGLTKGIESMLEKASDPDTLRIAYDLDPLDGVLDKEQEINLYRIVQEAIANIIKHADASEASVALKRRDHSVEVVVSDNGKGFSASGGERRRGFGLLGITERARMLGGQSVVNSAPGRGTTVSVKINLKERMNGR
jgi:signal transduction histidine kinase/ligand-binding sensor domain-containing protein